MVLAVQSQAFIIPILILLDRCAGWGIYYSGYEQHFVAGTKLTDLGKKRRPTISLLNKTHSLFFLLGNFVG